MSQNSNHEAVLRVRDILALSPGGQPLTARGWVRTKRDSKHLVFFEINDGSCLSNVQVVFDNPAPDVAAELARAQTGASVVVRGTLEESPARGQSVEIHGTGLTVVGQSPAELYPLQKKRHSFEYLREIAHLRPRTNTFGAIARVRNQLSFAIHRFFQERQFLYLHTPIITASDAEGAGEMFRVTTLSPDAPPRNEHGAVDFGKDFFGRPAYLTVSGQLNAEIYACALDRVYTFGPTFRAENSNTTRHLAEFWMIEPEVAFCDINCNMDLAEDFLKYLLLDLLQGCGEDMAFFDSRVQPGLLENLQLVVDRSFQRISYTEAVEALSSSGRSFEYPVSWGVDLQSEHEKFLTEEVYRGPVIVTDYPKEIKAFYMKLNDDGKTVRGMDVLVPRLGEIIGGSEREANLETLEQRITESGLNREDYWWYLDLRRFGSVPHSGFGLGFERLIQYATGMQNIRDVIPFPRAVRSADF
ncbi:MAG: asparagine--tRNA ligase [Spirochaetaceae bacterium]|nr:MAG: asparagine--tRNA ligase [Spirochaetaceae bacterium]